MAIFITKNGKVLRIPDKLSIRQKEIVAEFNQKDTNRVTSGRGMSSLGEPFKVSKPSSKIKQSDLIRMQRDAGVRG